MNGTTEAPARAEAGVRACEVAREAAESCGFHLTRSKWDPYPWVSAVDGGSAAEAAGMRPGDCVLEVNGEDVLGEKIGAVAERVRAGEHSVGLLLWNAGSDPTCNPESLCCGPMPGNLQRLSAAMNSILQVLECPVCLDMIPPPAHQCGNGHLICVRCRVKSERCPVCRVRFTRGRSLLADQVFNSLTDAFELRETPEEARPARLKEKIFGRKKTARPVPEVSISLAPTNKFLSRLMGKSCSVENLSSSASASASSSTSSRPGGGSVNGGLGTCNGGGGGGSKFLDVFPGGESAFATHLRAKSLSTGEICLEPRPVSRSTSTCSSTNRLSMPDSPTRHLWNGVATPPRAASCHDASDSLRRRIDDDFDSPDDRASYQCPCSADCQLFQDESVSAHMSAHHPGPLVQHFGARAAIRLPLTPGALTTLKHAGRTFLVQTLGGVDGACRVWAWIAGEERDAARFEMVVGPGGNTTPVRSLANDDVWEAPGVQLTAEGVYDVEIREATAKARSLLRSTSEPIRDITRPASFGYCPTALTFGEYLHLLHFIAARDIGHWYRSGRLTYTDKKCNA